MILRKEKTDLVIPDYNTFPTDGTGLLAQIRKDELVNKLLVVFLPSSRVQQREKLLNKPV